MSSAVTSAGRSMRYRTIDLVTIATLGVAFGVMFWAWGKIYEPIGTALGLSYPPSFGLLVGPWLMAGVVGGLIIRKPGAALATEVIAAAASALVPGGTQWGMSVLVSGFWQGLGVELILAIFLYRRFGVVVTALGGALAGAFEAAYEWSSYYADWDWPYRFAHLGFMIASGAVIAGIGGWALVRALASAGVLDTFGPGREAAHEV